MSRTPSHGCELARFVRIGLDCVGQSRCRRFLARSRCGHGALQRREKTGGAVGMRFASTAVVLSRVRLSSVALLPALVACTAELDRDPPVLLTLDSGKTDAIDRVTDRGALTFDEARTGAFTEDLEFHGYRLSARAGAELRLGITQRGTARALDTTLFVFGPAIDGRFGTEAIAFDDDGGWGRQSRLSDLVLDEGGEYLVVVGTHDARGRGHYRLQATCRSEDCSALGPVDECHPFVGHRILDCVDAQVADAQGDPESPPLDRVDALELCTEGEALGPMFDELCVDPSLPFCSAGFDAFAQSMGPVCREALEPFAVQCVFGETFRAALRSPDLVVGDRRVLRVDDVRTELEAAQVVAALVAVGHDDVTTLEGAFARADRGEIQRAELWDRTSARPYVVYEFGAGDTSVGAFFALESADAVAVISDGFLERCSVAPGLQGGDCRQDEDCSIGSCVGRSEPGGIGRCTELDGFGEFAECSVEQPCDFADGLVCAGLTRGDQGFCLPAWMRGNFGEHQLELPVPEGGLVRTVDAYGLATVDMDVELELRLSTSTSARLRIVLTNPAGVEVLVFDGQPEGGWLALSGPILGFSGDESVNGPWTLRIEDTAGGATSVLHDWTLRLGSRWD